jgi:hypothetical protein
MQPLDEETLDLLRRTLGTVHGSDLAAHLRRDAVFLVGPGLDLLACAEAVATDDAAAVGAWVANGGLRRPTPEERDAWLAAPERRWRSVVVQPFVFIQSLE